MTDTPANPAVAARRKSLLLAIVGLVLILAAPFALFLTMENEFIRRTMFTAWVFLAAGVVATVMALRASRRIPVLILSSLTLVLGALLVVSFTVFTKLPAATTINQLAMAPDFTLPDQEGKPVSLSDLRGRDRVLLVFYRGHW